MAFPPQPQFISLQISNRIHSKISKIMHTTVVMQRDWCALVHSHGTRTKVILA